MFGKFEVVAKAHHQLLCLMLIISMVQDLCCSLCGVAVVCRKTKIVPDSSHDLQICFERKAFLFLYKIVSPQKKGS